MPRLPFFASGYIRGDPRPLCIPPVTLVRTPLLPTLPLRVVGGRVLRGHDPVPISLVVPPSHGFTIASWMVYRHSIFFLLDTSISSTSLSAASVPHRALAQQHSRGIPRITPAMASVPGSLITMHRHNLGPAGGDASFLPFVPGNMPVHYTAARHRTSLSARALPFTPAGTAVRDAATAPYR